MVRWLDGNNNRILLVMLVALVVAAVGIATPVLAQDDVTPAEGVYTELYNEVSPSVVSISVVARQEGGNGPMGRNQPLIGGGTGFVIDNEGHIVTNNHVVDGATEIEVSFVDGTLASAEVVGLDADSDLAVLQVNLPEEDIAALQPVTFADSSNLAIGQRVVAIGSPFGQRWTLTSGIISAIDRSIQGLTEFSIGGVIQTDAAINPGNSGGPLLDLQGRVIGVNSQIISRDGSSSGIGFAIPGNLAQSVSEELIENGFVNYSYLGIAGRDVYLPLIDAFGLENDTQGVVVAQVSPGGPASRADLQGPSYGGDDEAPNNPRAVPQSVDIITEINGQPLTGISELIGYLAAETSPGDTVTLTVLRLDGESSEEVSLDVRLTPRP